MEGHFAAELISHSSKRPTENYMVYINGLYKIIYLKHTNKHMCYAIPNNSSVHKKNTVYVYTKQPSKNESVANI